MELFKWPSSGPRSAAMGGPVAVYMIGYEVWGVVIDHSNVHSGQDLAPVVSSSPQRPVLQKSA
jgi:hypothetical protein